MGTDFRHQVHSPTTVPQIDYENAREKIARDGSTRYILDARGRPRVTEKFDPVTLQAKVTKIGQKYRAEATARLSVKIPVIQISTST